MNAEQIRAIAHRTAIEILGERLNLEQAEHYETFATRFLTALTEQAEPVATVWDSQCINVLLPDGTNLFLHPSFEQRNGGQLMSMTDSQESPAVERCAAHPEPAPLPDELVIEAYKLKELSVSGELALLAPEDLLSTVGGSPAVFCPDTPIRAEFEAWVRRHSPIAEFTKNAAGEYIVLGMQDEYMAFVAGTTVSKMESVDTPLLDDVAKLVENLRSRHQLMYKASPIPSVMTEAADMIERLAAGLAG